MENDFDNVFKNLKIEFPVKLKDIRRFERETNISISVFTFNENKSIVPLQPCENKKETDIDLFYFKEKEIEHYCLIKDLSRLVSSQKSKNSHKMNVCKMCLSHFYSKEKLVKHEECCRKYDCSMIVLPDKTNNTLEFTKFNQQQKVPFVIYADFESMLSKIDTCEPCDKTSYTTSTQKHLPYSFCYNVVKTNSSKNNRCKNNIVT